MVVHGGRRWEQGSRARQAPIFGVLCCQLTSTQGLLASTNSDLPKLLLLFLPLDHMVMTLAGECVHHPCDPRASMFLAGHLPKWISWPQHKCVLGILGHLETRPPSPLPTSRCDCLCIWWPVGQSAYGLSVAHLAIGCASPIELQTHLERKNLCLRGWALGPAWNLQLALGTLFVPQAPGI